MATTSTRSMCEVTSLMVLMLALNATADAQRAPLRWRLEPGDVFEVELRQRTADANQLRTQVLSALRRQPWSNTHDLMFVFRWEVTDIQDIRKQDRNYDTKIELTQTLKRVVHKMDVGRSVIAEQYDSAKPDNANPPAKAPNPKPRNALQPDFFANLGDGPGLFDIRKDAQKQLDKPVKIWLSQNGQLNYDTSAVDLLSYSSGDFFVRGMAAATPTLGDLVQTLLPKFPEDDLKSRRRPTWQREVKLAGLGVRLGVNKGKTIYTYTPLTSRGNNVKIRIEGNLDDAAREDLPLIKIEGFQAVGEIQFDTQRGHVSSAKLNQIVVQTTTGIREAFQTNLEVKIRRSTEAE